MVDLIKIGDKMKKKLNILFRTSGGKAKNNELGLGHVYRCINLGRNLRPHTMYFLIEDFGNASDVVKKNGFKNIHFLKKNIDLKSDIKKTLDFIKRKKIDIVIVDRFNVKLDYLKKIKKVTKLIVISDLKKINYPGDLIVNGFIGFDIKINFNNFKTKCLLGPKYQILNISCENYSQKTKKNQTLLVTFGGYDEKNLFDIFCKSLNKYPTIVKTKIILGPATKKTKEVKKFSEKFSNNLKIMKETKNMCYEISKSKFGICSGGITSYEFAAMNVPFAIICQYKHQLLTAQYWQQKGYAINFGLPNRNSQLKIQKYFEKILRNHVDSKPKKYSEIDGFGAKRVAKEILEIT